LEKKFDKKTHTETAYAVSPKNLALDLYCGTGTIAQIISGNFCKVVGVEIVEEAISAAKENADLNGIANCEFYAGDAFEILNSFESDAAEFFFDTIIVDPPRDGLHPKALSKIAALRAPKIIYVACKPKSLVRDLPVLIEAGYSPIKIDAVDMFPRTVHLEVITELQQTKFFRSNP
jgi:tRNA/tmRNA/rRNA uracil-C5-methylase (TrmA/RlmC/RlmD family)